jgi:hypothetical protein
MITDIDPYFVSTSTAQYPARSRATLHQASYAHIGTFDPVRAAREESFERTHGSLWVPGLLDRLTAPLTRYHE